MISGLARIAAALDPALEEILELLDRNVYQPFVLSSESKKLFLLDIGGVGTIVSAHAGTDVTPSSSFLSVNHLAPFPSDGRTHTRHDQ
jgi:hypothetical protein